MKKEDYNRAGMLLEQINKLKEIEKRIHKDYQFYNKGTDDQHLLETLNMCNHAITVLIEINQEKFDKL